MKVSSFHNDLNFRTAFGTLLPILQTGNELQQDGTPSTLGRSKMREIKA
jgi:hypothetical protein